MTDNDLEGEILDPVPVIDNSKLKQYIQENLVELFPMVTEYHRQPVDGSNEQTMGRLRLGGYKRDELIVISGINSNADIPMRVSGLADDTVVLVNNRPIDSTIEHKVALDDVISFRPIIMSDSNSSTATSDKCSYVVGRGKVGVALARRRKKAMRRRHKRNH